MITVQKRQRVRLVPLMQRESIPYVTDTICVTSFLADFYALSVSASLEYAINSGSNVPAFSTYSSDADADNA
jgi:hypothetical protein